MTRAPWRSPERTDALGAGLTWVLMFRRMRALTHLIGQTRPGPPRLEREVQAFARELNLRSVPQVRVVDGCIPPMVWTHGRRSAMLLPKRLLARLNDDQRATLLVHELAHLRRRDHWIRWLEMVAVGLYWWHPVAWWARREIQDAAEQCCDASVASTLPGKTRVYAQALLDTVDFLAGAPPVAPATASAFGQVRRLRRRLKAILSGNRARRVSWPARVALTTFAAGVLPFTAIPVAGVHCAPIQALRIPPDDGPRLAPMPLDHGWSSASRSHEPRRGSPKARRKAAAVVTADRKALDALLGAEEVAYADWKMKGVVVPVDPKLVCACTDLR